MANSFLGGWLDKIFPGRVEKRDGLMGFNHWKDTNLSQDVETLMETSSDPRELVNNLLAMKKHEGKEEELSHALRVEADSGAGLGSFNVKSVLDIASLHARGAAYSKENNLSSIISDAENLFPDNKSDMAEHIIQNCFGNKIDKASVEELRSLSYALHFHGEGGLADFVNGISFIKRKGREDKLKDIENRPEKQRGEAIYEMWSSSIKKGRVGKHMNVSTDALKLGLTHYLKTPEMATALGNHIEKKVGRIKQRKPRR